MNFFKSVFSDDPNPNPNTQGSTSDPLVNKNDEQNQDGSDQDEPKPNLVSYPSSPLSFFKAILSPDPDPNNQADTNQESSPNAENSSSKANANSFGGGEWNFGGLVKSLATKSESVLETYRRDLKEFGSELKKEGEVLREVTSRAVKELPASIEVGASKAQGSFETVGHVIDGLGSSVWKGTTQIIARGKDALLAVDQESDSSDSQSYSNPNYGSKQYSRLDVQVRKIQSELSSFLDEPEDLDDYKQWRLGFLLEDKGEELERLFEENGVMEEMYKRIVPNEIDHETFWVRYFYKVHKLEQADDARAKLLQKAISAEDDDDLTWDFDEDDDDEDTMPGKSKELKNKELGADDSKRELKEENLVEESQDVDSGGDGKGKIGDEQLNVPEKVDSVGEKEGSSIHESEIGMPGVVDEECNRLTVDNASKSIAVDSNNDILLNDKTQVEGTSGVKKNDLVAKSEEKTVSEGSADRDVSSNNSEFTVLPGKPSIVEEEEDLGWDEIEDIGSGDEKRATSVTSPDKSGLKKPVTAADEDEDLSWDVEDDDDNVPVKSLK